MTFKQELIDLPLIGEKRAAKILAYAKTKSILITKLNNNYQEMIDLFRDDVVALLVQTYISEEPKMGLFKKDKKPKKEVKVKPKKEAKKNETPIQNKQNAQKVFNSEGLSRFVDLGKNKVQYDCPGCQNYIQIEIGSVCPQCGHKIK